MNIFIAYSTLAPTTIVLLLSVFSIVTPFCIDEIAGIDQGECIRYQDDKCCKSLQFFVATMKNESRTNDINVTILGENTISDVVQIVNYTNLVLRGRNTSTLRCNGMNNTGLYFERVRNLMILNLDIQGCSMLTNSTTSALDNLKLLLKSLSAVYIINCHSVSLIEVRVRYNHGRGVVMYDTGGEVVIHKSTFEGNKVPLDSLHPGGGGLYVEFACQSFKSLLVGHKNCTNEMVNSSYVITQSNFTNNSVFEINPTKTNHFNYDSGSFQGQGRGGGMCFILDGETRLNSIMISQCMFVNNSATTWGGGMYVSLRSNAHGNTIKLIHTHFVENKCTSEGGGGLKWSFLSYKGSSSSNSLLVAKCNFTRNVAETNGGGVAIVSSRETVVSKIQNQLDNTITFSGCNWRNNKAELGSAIDISPAVWNVLGNGVLPVPLFVDCIFEDNHIMRNSTLIHEGIEQVTSGVGTMLITNFAVWFLGSIHFVNNNGTGIYMQSGQITLLAGSKLSFVNNTAKHGGAIAFIAYSVMYIEPNTATVFRNNRAFIKGGAVYVKSIDQHERFSSRSCFLQSSDRNTRKEERNVTIIFQNNTADSGYGNSMYATTLQSCMYSCTVSSSNTTSTSIFDCLGSIQGLNNTMEHDVTTLSRKFEYDPDIPLTKDAIIPGRYFKIPIKAFDELGQISKIVYGLSLGSRNNISLDDINSAYISNQRIRVLGPQQTEHNTLLLERDETTIRIKITTTKCPPGHYLTNSVCRCDTSKLRGIWKCNRRNKIASIINGFWIGQCSNDEQCTGLCPIGYCTGNISTDLTMRINETDQYVCNNNREGKLCGKCEQNHSAYYHSTDQRCGEESLCRYGIILYIISELLPVTFVFIVIIMCNISFSNGSTNGFILYAQILDSLIINLYSVVHSREYTHNLKDIIHFVYGMSNLNFFNLEQLSFCLWKGATTLDALVWRYVTIAYALFLVLMTIWLLNRTTCKKICICWRPHSLKNVVIHGLTAFLVMCYSQCARVTFQLLNTVHLTGYNLKKIDTVIQFSGEHKLFDSVHAKYGLTAIVFGVVIVILPPLLLILYPLSLNLLALCHLSELKIVNKMTNVIPTPLFDSFQSCYKDRFRFFSGIYFFYRVTPLLLHAAAPSMVIFYFLVEIFLVMALSIHAIFQPYKKLKHNVIDSLIFANLAIINAISLFNYQKVTEWKGNLNEISDDVITTTAIQLVLIYLPLICVITYVIGRMLKWVKRWRHQTNRPSLDQSQQSLLDSTQLPPLRDDSTKNVDTIPSTLSGLGFKQEYHEMASR